MVSLPAKSRLISASPQPAFRSWIFFLAGAPMIFVLFGSSNVSLWFASGAAVLIAGLLLWDQWSSPVLLWVVGMNWLPVVVDIAVSDLAGKDLLDPGRGIAHRGEAIIVSLLSLIALALGMRLGRSVFSHRLSLSGRGSKNLTMEHAVIFYFLSLLLVAILAEVAKLFPTLTQPLRAFGLLKYVSVYILAAIIFENSRGYCWLALVLLIETATGVTGFFADYKSAFFVVLIAMAAIERKQTGVVIFGALSLAVCIWLSLVWTAAKPSYRYWVSGYTGEQTIVRSFSERLHWILNYMLNEPIDYGAAGETLLDRIGYTGYYAITLSRLEEGSILGGTNFYLRAAAHVLTPRFLFPEKDALDDSAITTQLTGIVIDRKTSISVGYTAEAHVDFGMPGMFVAIYLIGVIIVAAVRYFVTRPGPLHLRQGCATACAFLPFTYGTNIDNALGAFVTGFLALAVCYPVLAGWLAVPANRRKFLDSQA
jgi:hypothetical protein